MGRGSGKVLLQEVDETVGGRVVRRHLSGVLQLRLNLFSQLLSEFHPGGEDHMITLNPNSFREEATETHPHWS